MGIKICKVLAKEMLKVTFEWCTNVMPGANFWLSKNF